MSALPLHPAGKISAGDGSDRMLVGSGTEHIVRVGRDFQTVWKRSTGEPVFYRIGYLAMYT
jgi:hypothetical protein